MVAASPVPVFLAGGLHAGNVAEAAATVQPFGVDLCTGLRTDSRLDPLKVQSFMAGVANVDVSSHQGGTSGTRTRPPTPGAPPRTSA